jgi:nicotinate-nucleotide adenylyltransferase
MKIGILGGAFDPPHLGHLIVSMEIKEYLHLDEMWLMPVFSHAFDKKLSPVPHRVNMAQLCESDDIKCSLYEIEKGATNYTIETLKSLEKERPKDDFYFCIGADMLPDFHKWKDWEALKDTKKLVVYPRGDMKMSLTEAVLTYMKLNSLPSNIRVMDFQDVVKSNISSISLPSIFSIFSIL